MPSAQEQRGIAQSKVEGEAGVIGDVEDDLLTLRSWNPSGITETRISFRAQSPTSISPAIMDSRSSVRSISTLIELHGSVQSRGPRIISSHHPPLTCLQQQDKSIRGFPGGKRFFSSEGMGLDPRLAYHRAV